MKIEHVAFQVPSPAEAADWYCRHLGFRVKRGADDPLPVRFLADDTDAVMIEIYNNPAAPMPDYASMDPLLLHVALVSHDIAADRQRLIDAGAKPAGEITRTPAGDEVAMLRDPWDVPIQLCRRAEPMV